MKLATSFIFTVLIALSTMISAPAAQAQDMKIGFVDPRAVLERMPEMRAVQQRLQNFAERKQRELTEMERELQTEIELYQQKVGVISENAQQQEEERLTEMDQNFRQMQNRAQQEMQEERQRLMAPLLDQIQTSINAVADRKGIDYVLNTTTSTGDVIILYVSEEVQQEYDITDEVMADLDI